MEWVEGVKGPWPGQAGIELVRTGLRCCVDQLMTTGLFHADPHRGNCKFIMVFAWFGVPFKWALAWLTGDFNLFQY